jgi:hypothetical protein
MEHHVPWTVTSRNLDAARALDGQGVTQFVYPYAVGAEIAHIESAFCGVNECLMGVRRGLSSGIGPGALVAKRLSGSDHCSVAHFKHIDA